MLEAIADADRIVIAPSNPFVSVEPILAVDGVREAVRARRADVVAVTPLIGGRAVKGPLAEMLQSLGREQSAVGVAAHLADIAGAFVLDAEDASLAPRVAGLGVRAIVTRP